ncbi:MAG: radical SAM protein [Candidatus Bathyarchaeota archaeon]|nr:radical SAM protein [Candidatus Bathyarchaeota archaeon]
MNHKINNGCPYDHVEHWPPMTYRDRSAPTSQILYDFTNFLKKEGADDQNRELQPWLPFCECKCAFCYFTVSCDKQNIVSYIAALKKALALYAENNYVKSSTFTELYVGGGSPSVISAEQIADVLSFCRKTFNLKADHLTKFTACTNSLSEDKISTLCSNKVDQLDIGIQTFNDSLRKTLMIRDSSREAKDKLRLIKKRGFGVSIDLLYNLPSQTLDQWRDDIRQALQLEVESVDCYPLDLYPETPLAKKIAAGELPPLGNDSLELDMYLEAYRIFKENGYKPTCHNRFSRVKEDFNKVSSEVVGTGAGFFMGHIDRFLYSDIEDIQSYILKVKEGSFPIARLSKISKEEEMRKAMMLIYIRVPIDREEFKTNFGRFPEEVFPNEINKLENEGLIEERDGKIQLTEKGEPWRFNISWEFFKNGQNKRLSF